MIPYTLVTVRKELWGLCCIDSWIRAKPKRRDFLRFRQKGEIPRRHPTIGKYRKALTVKLWSEYTRKISICRKQGQHGIGE